jgi:adenylylsulfate kinase
MTGPPAAGKSTLARAFRDLAAAEAVRAVHLESDELRKILTPEATYEADERDRFYRELADIAAVLVSQGFPVIVDATAPRRAHRAYARSRIPAFFEVFVDAPESVRRGRDPKGLYRLAREGKAPHLPGATEPYEPPENPDLALSGELPAREAAASLLDFARRKSLV